MVDTFLRAFYWRQCRTTRRRVAAQCQPAPAPGGSGAKYKKNHKYSMGGGGDSIHCGLQGQALLTASHSHPEFSKIQIAKIYNPSGLLTKIKYQVPNTPRVRRWLENQGQSHGKSQVKTGREQTEAGET